MRHLLAAVLLAVATPAQNVEAPPRFAEVRAAIVDEIADDSAPSLAVAVFEAGSTVWAEGFGLADIERNRAATADTIYRLASISKPFTATAIMQLVERQLVDLDAPVNRYLDEPLRAYRGTADAITARRLLNHTGGLPTHWNFFYAGEQPPPRSESIRAYGFAFRPAGTGTNYSNLAFGVLDHLIARVGKHPGGYRGWLRAELLDPLRMTHTDVGVRPGREAFAATGYDKQDGKWRPVRDYGFDHDGASAVRSSARDLMRFARLQLEAGAVDGVRLLDEASVLAMRERTGRDAGSSFGVGWSVSEDRGQLVLRHSGGMPGVSTHLVLLPGLGTACAVLTNCHQRGATNRTLEAILEVLLGPPGRRTGFDAMAAKAPARRIGTFHGQIAHPNGPLPLKLVVTDDDAGLTIGDGESVAVKASPRQGGLQLAGEHAFDLGHGRPQQATLSCELDNAGTGYDGVLYATADGICRLPFWCELVPEQPKPPATLRTISYNVLVGFRDQSVGRFLPGAQREQKISAWLAAQQPDVVGLQEMNGYDQRRLERLASAWGHAHVALLKEDGFPVALTSSKPIEVVARHREKLHHGMLHATTHGIDFVVVHFRPHPGVDYKVAECERALACYRAALGAGRQAIVLGDFNSIAPHDTQRFSPPARARYDRWRYLVRDGLPAEIAMTPLLDAGAVDVLLRVRGADEPLPLPRIDFVLASPDLAANCTAAHWLCDPERLRLSDHPPVVADFAIRGDGPNRK